MSIRRVAVITLVALGLAGCVGPEIAEEVYLDYDGDLRDAVVACSLEAADGRLRDDARVPSGIYLTDISHSYSPGTGAADVSGVVSARESASDGSTVEYAWRCTTDSGGGDPTIVSFEPVGG
ncbi:hypothetical protein [Yonghaparkia sp. Soil809]|uniref:hypothetical protein n=1 Tax=Yonghaparkia sp. Soil809 TaxID=1736417 RepID=UPI0006FC3AE2|nr:hypothetical protein [Yonghaparkia sp. Soil809]KRF32780.1 hypothetical protein ASG83_01690 [Yonghaparkia sp. Soil809]